MKVTLIHSTPVEVAVEAALVCTASLDKADTKDTKEFLYSLIQKQHLSVFEHLTYTFHIEDITRGLLQELARHRHCSLSVESTRWALKKKLTGDAKQWEQAYRTALFTIDPKAGDENEKEKALYKAYSLSLELNNTIKNLSDLGFTNDALKPFIQEGFFTSLYFTTNARELMHIFSLRSKPNVYREFRELVGAMHWAVPVEHRFMYFERR